MSEIHIYPTEKSRISEVDFGNIVFGKEFADHMFIADFDGEKWRQPRIVPYGNLSLSPALSCMHYGQAIFEGMKAYRDVHGKVVLFRPLENWKRLNESALRMCMPELDKDIFIDGLVEWLRLDQSWVPGTPGSSLYIRPFMIATDDYLGVKPSRQYSFMIYGCPVNAYYSHPLRIKVEREFVRAVRGGVGYAKAAGNYAAAMLPTSIAQKEGFHQLIWTDALEHEYLEELGTSNIFLVTGDTLLTPSTSDTILKGITRDSILKLARSMGYKTIERRVSVTEMVEMYHKGQLDEAFATGTAATITPIESITVDGQTLSLQPDTFEATMKLGDTLEQIKRGYLPDEFDWVYQV